MFENLILSEDVHVSHNFVPCIFAPKENALEKSDEPTPTMSNDYIEYEARNQNKNQTNGFFEIIQNPPHNDSCDETKKRFKKGDRIWKGNVYERRNHNQVVEDFIPQLNQEFKPSKSQPTKIGKTLLDPSPLYNDLCVLIAFRKLYNDLDVPIALRKSGRSCTRHPLFNFTSYLNLSSSFAAFTSHLSSVEIPKNVQQALEVPKWKEAALD